MNALFASAALGLVAAWPASGLGWLLGKTADRLTGDPLTRAKTWNLAVALPPVVLGLMVAAAALPSTATDPVYQVAMTSQAMATTGAAISEVSARTLSRLDGVEMAAGLLLFGALGGLAVAATRQLLGRAKLRRIVASARPVERDLAQGVRAAARRLDTGRPDVKVSPEIDQPMLAGLAAPVILLPAAMVARLSVERIVPICAHELAHLKRDDNWRQLFEHLLGGLLWMVPPFAAVRAQAAATREELADAMALENAVTGVRRTYAETLIEVLRHRAAPTLHPAFTGKGRKPTLMRLQAITAPRNPAGFGRRALLGLASLLVLALVAGGSIALAQQAQQHSNTRTVITDDRTGQYVDIRSDYVQLAKAQPGDTRPLGAQGQVSTYRGHVQVRGRLHAPETIVLLNGEAAPDGFDPTALPRGAIDRVEVAQMLTKDRSRVTLNVIMRPRA